MVKPEHIQFNAEQFNTATAIMRALAHPLRLRMVALLQEQPLANVHTIYTTLQIEQSVASQHLRILRQAGIVVTKREGKFIHYQLQKQRLEKAGRIAGLLAALADQSASEKER